jgi:hypothetical protein
MQTRSASLRTASFISSTLQAQGVFGQLQVECGVLTYRNKNRS